MPSFMKVVNRQYLLVEDCWQEECKTAIKEHSFNVIFDALGGGETLVALIIGLVELLGMHLWCHQEEESVDQVGLDLSRGVYISSFLLFVWSVSVP
jgi:hypothetical protein